MGKGAHHICSACRGSITNIPRVLHCKSISADSHSPPPATLKSCVAGVSAKAVGSTRSFHLSWTFHVLRIACTGHRRKRSASRGNAYTQHCTRYLCAYNTQVSQYPARNLSTKSPPVRPQHSFILKLPVSDNVMSPDAQLHETSRSGTSACWEQ